MPKMARGIHCFLKFFTSFARIALYIVKSMRARVCVCLSVCIHIHILTAYRLHMNYRCYQMTLPMKRFPKIGSGAKCRPDIHHWGADLAATGRIRDIGQNVLQSSFQTGTSSSPSYCHVFFLIAVLEMDFIR
jgi:hypothetical protein